MPSVFTIEGVSDAASRPSKKRDGCKEVVNKRTGCVLQLCPVPKSKSPTGWAFQKGAICPPKGARKRKARAKKASKK